MKVNKKFKRLFSFLLVVALLFSTFPTGVVTVSAADAEFAGGNGTEFAPYLISTKEHLNNARNYLDAHFKMTADIEFAAVDFVQGGSFYNNGAGWTPIGNTSTPFAGTFDGNGYIIRNLRVNVSNSEYAGLFGLVCGTVKNLGMVDSQITATFSVGDTVGDVCVGGIVARVSGGAITGCYNTGTVLSSGIYRYGAINIGGIVGLGGNIANCYNTGTVSDSSFPYSSTSTSSYANVGGVVGCVTGGIITNCYNISAVAASSYRVYAGGIAGRVSENEPIINCYYLDRVLRGVGYGTDACTKYSLEELQQQETFVGFDFESVWEIDTKAKYSLPTLRGAPHVLNETENATEFAGGTGEFYNPYLIATKEHLNNVRNHLDAYYKMISDIVFTEADFAENGDFYNKGKGWNPIGESYESRFLGVFDGNGFAIVGLCSVGIYTLGSRAPLLGLFSISEGTIMNLAMTGGSVTITSSSYSNKTVGGIVGRNTGTISNCYNTRTVCGEISYGGGIAGSNSGLIVNCYNAGDIGKQGYATGYIGGIVGVNGIDGTLLSCYNAGCITATHKGGIAGENAGKISNCYFIESDLNGCASGTEAGYRCTVEKLKTETTFQGFDFETIWKIDPLSDYPFPMLRGVSHKTEQREENLTEFSGGTGSGSSPYLISKTSQLQNVQKYPGAFFKLTNDLVFTVDENNTWVSIGSTAAPFCGFFDGDGYSIQGLTKSLFNQNRGTIKNLALEKAKVSDIATMVCSNYGLLYNCFSSSEISFKTEETFSVGGLVSNNYAVIKDCFYQGNISSSTTSNLTNCYTGGIVGTNTKDGLISCCYSLGIFFSTKTVGGLVGLNDGTISNSYCYELTPSAVGSGTMQGTRATAEQLKSQDFYGGFDFESVWTIDSLADYPAPTLRVARSKPVVSPENTEHFSGGRGNLFYPFLISTQEQLDNISKYAKQQLHFKLINDVICNEEKQDTVIPVFNGIFDGNSHSIKNLTLNASGSKKIVGFIGQNSGSIKNLNLENSNLVLSDISESYIGPLVGMNKGNVIDVSVESDIRINNLIKISDSAIGGIAGQNGKTIKNSIASGKMDFLFAQGSFDVYIGGIVGIVSSLIEETTSKVNIIVDLQGPDIGSRVECGGIAGNSSGSIKKKVRNEGDIHIHTNSIESGGNRLYVGGVVGTESGGTTLLSSNAGGITVNSNTERTQAIVYVGGIIGRTQGIIRQSYNTGNIIATANIGSVVVGGLFANANGSIIEDSYNAGDLTAMTEDSEYSYSAVGGIFGSRGRDTAARRCYNIGKLTADKVAGITCYNNDIVSHENMYYINSAEKGVYSGDESNTYACSAEQMTNPLSFLGFDFNMVWEINSVSGYYYPTLRGVPHVACEHICEATSKAPYYDSEDHWDRCLSCGKRLGLQAHSFAYACQENCSACDYIRETVHTTNNSWQKNKNIHWQDCLVCYKKINNQKHTYLDAESLSCSVCLMDRELLSISATQQPNKTTYLEGDALDKTGMVVTACYNNDTSGVVTSYTVSGYTSTPGTKTITISYGGKTTTFTVTVKAKTLSSVKVTAKPNKLTYLEGESFNKTGMVVTAYYNNNTSAAVTDYTVGGYTSTPGTKTITVTHGGKTATFTVTVNAKTLTSIAVTKKPTKLTYLEGDSFNKTGMVVTAYYNNNTSAAITDYTVSGYTSTPGTKTITVSYGGKTATFIIVVEAKKTPSTPTPSQVPASITSSKHTINGKNISKITAGTTVSSLLSGLNEGSYCKVYKGKDIVSGNTAVGTGMVVKIMDGNTVKASYTVIVTGDTNGDGAISVTDMIAIKAHLLKKSTLSGAAATAADTNGDNGISITDFIQIKAKILGKGSIVAR